MTDLANSTISAAQSLYGSTVAAKVRAAFHARGIV
jgi:Zn-dependent metalloprotease